MNKALTVNDIEILKARPLLTAREWGLLNGLSEITVRRLCYSGEIESVKIGNSLRVANKPLH